MTTSGHEVVVPNWRFVLAHPARFLAFGFGSGLSPVAPGTAGTLVAFPLYGYLHSWFGGADLLFLFFLLQLFFFGSWVCGRTGRELGVHDHGGIVFDEIAAFLLVLFFTPDTVLWKAAAFILFRFFDIVKPPPIGHYDRVLKGGFGVMADDYLAAGYALLCLALLKTLLP